MKTALCLGGGACLEKDVADFHAMGVPYDVVIACNDAGYWWNGRLDHWVSLHPNKFTGWMEARRKNGYPAAGQLWAHRAEGGSAQAVKATRYQFPRQSGSGSSGLFMAKVALEDLRLDRVVLCGVPLYKTPHFFDDKDWQSAESFRRAWLQVAPETLGKMRSMSGWTKVLLGSPKDWAVNAGVNYEG